jgi:hypothetical protein
MYRVDWLAAALDGLADVQVTLERADQDRVAAAVGLRGPAYRVADLHDPAW